MSAAAILALGPESGTRARPARALPEQEHSEAGLSLLLGVSAVLERLGVLDMFTAEGRGGELALNHLGTRDPDPKKRGVRVWSADPDEMQGVRDKLDEAGFDAKWVGGQTITVREVA